MDTLSSGMLGVAAVAVFAAGASAWIWRLGTGRGSLPGCGAGSGCNAVLRSRWSRWGPLPVVAPAAAIYGLAFASAAALSLAAVPPFAAPRRATAQLALPLLCATAAVGAGAAVWFIGLQVLVVRRFCWYCTAVHAAGLAMASLVAWHARTDFRPMRDAGGVAGAVVAAGAVLTFLIGGQLLLKPRRYAVLAAPAPAAASARAAPLANDQGSADNGGPDGPARTAPQHAAGAPAVSRRGRRVRAYGGRVDLAVADWPLLGLPSAPRTAVLLLDYTCAECRHLRRLLGLALAHLPGRLAVLLVPVPLDPACNPAVTEGDAGRPDACGYARLAWALWQADPLAYARFDEWALGPKCAPPLAEAVVFARQLAAGVDFSDARQDPLADARLAEAAAVYRAAEGGRLPALLFPNSALRGHVESSDALLAILQRELNLAPLPVRPPAARPAARTGPGARPAGTTGNRA